MIVIPQSQKHTKLISNNLFHTNVCGKPLFKAAIIQDIPQDIGLSMYILHEWESTVAVNISTNLCFNVLCCHRSLATTVLLGGMPISSQRAVITVRHAPRLSNTTATLYPERGPAHTYGTTQQQFTMFYKFPNTSLVTLSKQEFTSRSPSIRTFFAWTPSLSANNGTTNSKRTRPTEGCELCRWFLVTLVNVDHLLIWYDFHCFFSHISHITTNKKWSLRMKDQAWDIGMNMATEKKTYLW